MTREQAGFTLIEIMVVVLILGILAALAIPQYVKTIETSKADDGAALANMVGQANHMYELDHPPTFLVGQLDNTCNSGAACMSSGGTSVCELVFCRYLPSQDFNSKPYIVGADTPGGSLCSGATFLSQSCGSACAGCVARKTSVNCGGLGGAPNACNVQVGKYSPYTTWGYGVTTAGALSSVGTNPPAAMLP